MSSVELYASAIQEFLQTTTESPCSAIGQAFEQLVPPELRFQVAVHILWPSMQSGKRLDERIQAAFLLYQLYAPHPVGVNPFKSAYEEALRSEKANDNEPAPNPMVATLEIILNGKGAQLSAFSPLALASGPSRETVSPRSITSSTSGSSGHTEPSEDVQVHNLLQEAPERVLTIPEQKFLARKLPTFEFSASIYVDLPYIIAQNPAIASHVLSRLIARSTPEGQNLCFDAIAGLRATMANFDLIAKLLQDYTRVYDGSDTIAGVVREAAMGRFLESCEADIERQEAMEGPGGVAMDSPCAIAVHHFCRFCLSLVRLGILVPTMDAEIAQVLRFSLRCSRYREANALYRTITAIRNEGGGG